MADSHSSLAGSSLGLRFPVGALTAPHLSVQNLTQKISPARGVVLRTRIKVSLVASAVGALACVGGISPAYATTNGAITNCAHYDETLCLFFNSDNKGSHVGIYGTVNYSVIPWACPSDGCPPYRFVTSGTGYGDTVKNHAASAYNENTGTYWVYFNSNQMGPADKWDPEGLGTWYGNLTNTYNNNASQECWCVSG